MTASARGTSLGRLAKISETHVQVLEETLILPLFGWAEDDVDIVGF